MTTATKTQTSHKKRKIPPKVIRKTWTSAEVSELGELYGTITTTELATRYGVSPQQVREKASALGLANQRVKARNRAAQQAAEEAKECKQRTAHGEQRITEHQFFRVITHTIR